VSITKNKILSCLVISLCFFQTQAQNLTFSPYSRYGIGEVNQRVNSHIMGAGGAFIALQPDTLMPILINQANPAALAHIRLTTLDLGGQAEKHQFITTSKALTKQTVNFSYGMVGMPIRNNGGLCFGLMPYSTVGYNMQNETETSGIGAITYKYAGQGGLNKAFLGYGILPFKNAELNYRKALRQSAATEHPVLFSKGKLAFTKLAANTSIGVNAHYLFGTLEQSTQIVYPSNALYFSTQRQRDLSIQGVNAQFGLQTAYVIDSVSYRDTSGVKRKRALVDKVKFSFGYYFNLNNTLPVKYDALVYNYLPTSLGNQVVGDTVLNVTNQKTTIKLPVDQGVGFGFRKGDKLHVLVDASLTNWSNFKLIDPIKELKQSYRIAFGVHYIPNRSAAGTGAYLQRVQYRIGAYYNSGYLEIRNTVLSRTAATAGFGLPVGIGRRSSIINIGAELGQYGSTNNNLMLEKYWRLNIGFTFNAFEDRWFRKVKYD
jgi:hypothetical protein